MRIEERFWSKVRREEKDTCWEWQGGKNNSGYGILYWCGRVVTAHRLAAFLCGLVPSINAPANRRGGGFVLHQCDNKACCNPSHMRIGTYTQNQKEAYQRKCRASFKGHLHKNAKIARTDVAKIQRKYLSGNYTQTELAKEYKVSQACISRLVRGVSY